MSCKFFEGGACADEGEEGANHCQTGQRKGLGLGHCLEKRTPSMGLAFRIYHQILAEMVNFLLVSG